jgi:hypothetical protein
MKDRIGTLSCFFPQERKGDAFTTRGSPGLPVERSFIPEMAPDPAIYTGMLPDYPDFRSPCYINSPAIYKVEIRGFSGMRTCLQNQRGTQEKTGSQAAGREAPEGMRQ